MFLHISRHLNPPPLYLSIFSDACNESYIFRSIIIHQSPLLLNNLYIPYSKKPCLQGQYICFITDINNYSLFVDINCVLLLILAVPDLRYHLLFAHKTISLKDHVQLSHLSRD